MILLDTDHLSLLKYPDNQRFAALTARMEASPDQDIGTTVISLEEQMRGWLAAINRFRQVQKQTEPYQELLGLVRFFSRWTILPFDDRAADRFNSLRKQGVRIGSMDLKIASICLVNDALLISANLGDFRHVPGLRVENWLE